jgi:hypothetical protein
MPGKGRSWGDQLNEPHESKFLSRIPAQARAQEEQGRRRTAYVAAVAERDKLAKELAAVYPAMAEQLADLAGRIAANDAVIEHVNQRSPEGAPWIAGAELIARQLNSFFDGTADVPRIVRHMSLPAFRYAALDPYIWPLARK